METLFDVFVVVDFVVVEVVVVDIVVVAYLSIVVVFVVEDRCFVVEKQLRMFDF